MDAPDGAGLGTGLVAVFIAFIVVIVAVIIIAVVVSSKRHKALVAQLQALCAQMGWNYLPSNPDLPRRWRVPPFGTGGSRRAVDQVYGPYRGYQVSSFEYSYTTTSGSGQNQTTETHYFHVTALALPRQLPHLAITPESVFSRVAQRFFGRDIQFESPQFNKTWAVRADDERYAYGVLSPRTLEWMMTPGVTGHAFQILGPDALCICAGRRRLDAIVPTLNVLVDFVSQIPRMVWDDYGQ